VISLRYVPAVILLLLVALVPTVIHLYLGLEEDDGLRTSAVPMELAGFKGKATQRRKAWGLAMFGSHDWFERLYEKEGRRVRLFVGRGYDPKRLYHHPEIALSRGFDLAPERIVVVQGIPVHLLEEEDGEGIAAYVLLSGDGFIEKPVAHQLATALWQLFHPRRQMTLFYVAQADYPVKRPFEKSDAERVLLEAIRDFRGQK